MYGQFRDTLRRLDQCWIIVLALHYIDNNSRKVFRRLDTSRRDTRISNLISAHRELMEALEKISFKIVIGLPTVTKVPERQYSSFSLTAEVPS